MRTESKSFSHDVVHVHHCHLMLCVHQLLHIMHTYENAAIAYVPLFII